MIRISEEDFRELVENCGGICLSCENQQSGCEPDVRNYQCEECGANQVFGAEELLVMGKIEFTEDKGDESDDV